MDEDPNQQCNRADEPGDPAQDEGSRRVPRRKFGTDVGMCPAASCGRNPMGQQEVHEYEAPGGHGNGNRSRVIAARSQSVKGKTSGVPPPLTLCALPAEK